MNVIQGKTIAVREVETYGVNAKPLSPRSEERRVGKECLA